MTVVDIAFDSISIVENSFKTTVWSFPPFLIKSCMGFKKFEKFVKDKINGASLGNFCYFIWDQWLSILKDKINGTCCIQLEEDFNKYITDNQHKDVDNNGFNKNNCYWLDQGHEQSS